MTRDPREENPSKLSSFIPLFTETISITMKIKIEYDMTIPLKIVESLPNCLRFDKSIDEPVKLIPIRFV